MTTQFNGFYRAVVVNNVDPLKAGRVQVRVMPYFTGVPDAVLPWAILADPMMGGTFNQGSVMVPAVGAHLWVFFENGDYRQPVYFAAAPAIVADGPDAPKRSREAAEENETISTNRKTGVVIAAHGGGSATWDEPASAYAAEYPNNKVIRSAQGIVIEIDDTPGGVRLHVFHPSGTRSEVDNDGNQVSHVQGDQTTVILGKQQIYVDSTLDINAADKVRIKTGEVIIDGNLWVTGRVDVEQDIHGFKNAVLDMNVNAGANVTAAANVSDAKGSMQKMRDTYNSHTNPSSGASPPPQQMT